MTPADGSGTVTGVSAAGRDVGIGAEVTIVGRGSGYFIEDVHGYAPGAPGRDVNRALSTPSFETISGTIPTQIYTTTAGDIKVRAFFPIWQIAEQYRHRQVIKYKVVVREATGAKDEVMEFSTRAQGMVIRAVDGAITDTSDPITYTSTPNFGGPDTTLPGRYGIVQIDDELVLYDVHDDVNRELETLTRGYDGTTAAGHADGAYLLARSVTVAAEGLAPNTTYEAQVVAICDADGRQSNPSTWLTFITDYDVTPPSWTGPANLRVVSAGDGQIVVEWDPPDTDASDLLHYDVQVSTDGVTWGAEGNSHTHDGASVDAYDVGRGTRFVHPVEFNVRTYFRVRAVDNSFNASAWSAPVDDIVIQGHEYFYSSFEDGWDGLVASWTNIDATRSTTTAHSGTWSIRFGYSGFPIDHNGVLGPDSLLPASPGKQYRLSCWAFVLDYDANHYVALDITFYDANRNVLTTSTYTQDSGAGGTWREASVSAIAPAGTTWLKPEIRIFQSTAGTGVSDVYIDEVSYTYDSFPSNATGLGYDESTGDLKVLNNLRVVGDGAKAGDIFGVVAGDYSSLSERLDRQVSVDYKVFVAGGTCFGFRTVGGGLVASGGDHASVIQQVVNAAGAGSAIAFGSGVFTFGQAVTPVSDQVWVVANTTFRPTANVSILDVTTVDHFTLLGRLTIDDPGGNSTSVPAITVDGLRYSYLPARLYRQLLPRTRPHRRQRRRERKHLC